MSSNSRNSQPTDLHEIKLRIYTSKTNSSRVTRRTKKKRAKRGTAKVRSEATEMLSASQSIGSPLTLNLRFLLNATGYGENNIQYFGYGIDDITMTENESRPQKIRIHDSPSCTFIMNPCSLLMIHSMRVFMSLSLTVAAL